jgi:glycosyltransferase involved in cell wall biosynthesis
VPRLRSSMRRICFVTYEIFPTTRGGCGTLLHNAARVLLGRGHEVLFVLDVPHEYFVRFQEQDRLGLPNSERCRAYHVDTLCQDMDVGAADFLTEAEWRAFRFHFACQKVAAKEAPDTIEFFDYCGVAYHALAAKIAGLAYDKTVLAVRLHNSLELMDSYEPTKPLDLQRYGYYALEHAALQLAETVVYPSASYLADAYRPRYEPWLGRQVFSKPPLVELPHRDAERADADTILFYGRLFAFKGVDLFVDASVALAAERPGPRPRFVLAGHDSWEAPDGSASYQEFLRKKIPTGLQDRFVFADHLSWDQLRELLPSVLCAVFPSHLEAFCYAAHELYAAGVPIIVSPIPIFRDYFQHEVNALVFDGTTADLTRQMARLHDDAELRHRISRPFSLAADPLGTFYDEPAPPSWIIPGRDAPRPSLLVAVVSDDATDRNAVDATLGALAGEVGATVVVLEAGGAPDGAAGRMPLLGGIYAARRPDGTRVVVGDLRTADALLLLRAGDRPSAEYLGRALDTLARQPEIAFVSCWKSIEDGPAMKLQTFSIDVALEVVPFLWQSPFTRAVMRTEPGRLLVELFDPKAGAYGELLHLWSLESRSGRGITIPHALLTQRPEKPVHVNPKALAYLVMRGGSPWRHARLARYLLAVWGAVDAGAADPSGVPRAHISGRYGAEETVSLMYRTRMANQLDGRTLLRLAMRKLLKKLRKRSSVTLEPPAP